jgi:two-component system CheB/CheR fusion protein
MAAAKIVSKQYIIAIGASAGGLEAIDTFFDYTPLDGVSYILIQHLSPNFKSQMAQVLSRHSKLQIVEVTDQIKIETNRVYLIPSSNFMVVKDGKLILSDKKDKKPPHMTIDYFFTSLAEERGDKAIGVILSGTGNDGSKGIEAIKRVGGIVFAQDPDTANFSGMPLAAIATGCTDMVLSPQAMPQVIEGYVKDGILEVLTDQKSDEISESELKNIITLIKGNLPLDFTDYKRPTILRRVKRRMIQYNFSNVTQYYNFLKGNTKEIETLANDFLIGVTSFFRDAEAFKIIENKVIPDIIDRNTGDRLKIWVSGCATGEEAYSLAILVKEYLTKSKKLIEVKIFATDINKTALDTASKGIYPQTIEKNVSEERLSNFFTVQDAGFKIKPEIRKMLIFAQHDLVKNPPYCNIDLISCRNLLIYMNLTLQKKVFAMMHFGLKKDGYLFLGPSENAAILKADFDEISNKWNILQSNKSGRLIRFDAFSSPVIEGIKTTAMKMSKKTVAPMSKLAMDDEVNVAILEEAGFNGICTDENLMVVRSFGNPSAYLKNEIFNLNLNALLPDNISITFKAAAHKALKLNEKVTLKALNLDGDSRSETHLVDIVIRPIALNRSEERLLLILFVDNKSKAKEQHIIKDADINQLTKDHVIELEKELAEAKHSLDVANERITADNENMQSFNEELQSANEEMQSANEELQSANEELLSGSEELQSVNEELEVTKEELQGNNEEITTINIELQDRNEQLINSRRYTEEIFNTIHDPLIILDKQLKVIRATDGFYQTFKVTKEETEDHFLYDLGNRQWDIPVLRSQLENVLPEQGFFKAYEVDHVFKSIGRKIMRLTARQFDTHEHEKLTLLAIHDLTDKRKVEEGLAEAERLLEESKERLHFAIESAGIGTWDFNPLIKELVWDNRCKELYGLKPADDVNYGVYLNQVHADDRNGVDEAVKQALLGINNGEFNIEYRTIGLRDQKLRWIKSKGKAYFDDENIATRFIGTVLDISIEKSLEESTIELLRKKDEFISIASHELKTPITSLKASLQLLNRMKANPSPVMTDKLIDQSGRRVEKISRLIDDLLNVTSLNEGQLKLNKAPFVVSKMLAQCCTHVRTACDYTLITQGDEGLMINGDEDRIEQVVANFVNNAIKYAPESKNIYMIIEHKNDMAKVSVKDSGPGIAADKQPYLFDRYYRADYAGKQYSGLGLGLYICSEIIKRHGGNIGVESQLGKGSTFWFTVPLN